MSEIGLSIGSNLGDRLANLREARRLLAAAEPAARLVAQSPVYETEPVGVKPEYVDLKYLNAVLIFDTNEPAGEWLHFLGHVERDLGRVRTADKFAPRTIDIDILFHGEDAIESSMLIVPHPRWTGRRFVVQPLADVRPDLTLPGEEQTVRDILAGLADPAEHVRLFAAEW